MPTSLPGAPDLDRIGPPDRIGGPGQCAPYVGPGPADGGNHFKASTQGARWFAAVVRTKCRCRARSP